MINMPTIICAKCAEIIAELSGSYGSFNRSICWNCYREALNSPDGYPVSIDLPVKVDPRGKVPDCPFREENGNSECLASEGSLTSGKHMICKMLLDRELCPDGWR